MYVVLFLCLIFLHVQSAAVGRNNVCTDFRSYGDSQRAEHCYYDPDLDSTPSEIADRHGYFLDYHTVTTEDGYILTIFRLKTKDDNSNKSKQPVVLQHGILVDGRSWLISGNKSLGFILARNGYEVWIPNFRGTKYSTKHINPSLGEEEYWDYSFHEMGVYDVPAVMEYVSNTTKRNDIIYIGHSMGCTAFIVYTTEKTNHAQKYTKGIIYLAPMAYFAHPPEIMQAVLPFVGTIRNILKSLHIYSIGNLPEIQSFLSGLTCTTYPLILGCQIALSVASGLVVEQVRPEVLPLVVKFFPTGISVKTLVHFAQIVLNNGRFQQYDYGTSMNIQKYNSTQPPLYEVEKVKIPTQIFTGEKDILAEIHDVQKFYQHISAPKGLHSYVLSHLDFLYGKSVNKLYKDILDTLENSYVNNEVIK